MQAINDGMNVTANWQVIFFQMINNTFLNIHKGKPDYRRFIQVYVSDTKTRLGKLAEYVLNLEEGAITNPPADQPMPSVSLVTMFNDLLDDMNTALGINENDHGKLPERMVRPREFIEKCPPHYFNSASDCRWWVGWPSKYPKIAALKVSGKAKRKQQTEVTYVVTEYLKATDYKGGMPGLKRFMVDEIHAEFISADNEYTWTDPEGISYTKSKSRLENRLSDLKREHALKN